MFLISNNNEIFYLYKRELHKLHGETNEILAYIKENHKELNSININYINNFEIQKWNKLKPVKILNLYKKKLYIIERKLIRKLGLKNILYSIFWFSIDKNNSSVKNITNIFWNKISISDFKKVKIINKKDIIKQSFLLISKKNKKWNFFISSIKFSYWLWNYSKTDVVDNIVKWTDKKEKIAFQKAISELVERVSCSIIPKKHYKKTELNTENIYKKEWLKNHNIENLNYQKIYNIYKNNYVFIIEDFLYYPYNSSIWSNFADSSGVSTHYTSEKAILWGMLELIERDSFILMWLLRKWFYYLNERSLPLILYNDIQKIEIDFNVKIHFFTIKFDNPIPVTLSIIEKKWRVVVWLWVDIDLENSIKKSFTEAVSMMDFLEKTEKNPKNINNIFQHIYNYAKYDNKKNLNFLLSTKKTNFTEVKKLFCHFKNYKDIVKYYEKIKISFFQYKYNNYLNETFNRVTIRILSDLLPIYFWKDIPQVILKSSRLKFWKKLLNVEKINQDLHPFW